VPFRLADELHRFLNDLDCVEDEFAAASDSLSDVEHYLRNEVTKVPFKKAVQIYVEHHVDRLLVGNDVLEGGDGNDLMVGDDWSHLAPSVNVTATDVPAPWNIAKADRVRDNSNSNGDRKHVANDVLVAGNDTLNGGAGADLMFGDSAALLASAVTVSPQLKKSDSPAALHQGQDIAEHLLETGHHGWHDHDATGGDDVMNGGAGDDVIFGQDGRDILRGGAGNDWLIGGGSDKDVLEDTLGQNKLFQGENDSKALREVLATRLSGFGVLEDQPPAIKYKLPRIIILGA
jgi:hypothetical protein